MRQVFLFEELNHRNLGTKQVVHQHEFPSDNFHKQAQLGFKILLDLESCCFFVL